MEKMQEALNTVHTITKGIEEIKHKQIEMKNPITDIKNTLDGINSRITEAELEDRMVEITAESRIKGKE